MGHDIDPAAKALVACSLKDNWSLPTVECQNWFLSKKIWVSLMSSSATSSSSQSVSLIGRVDFIQTSLQLFSLQHLWNVVSVFQPSFPNVTEKLSCVGWVGGLVDFKNVWTKILKTYWLQVIYDGFLLGSLLFLVQYCAEKSCLDLGTTVTWARIFKPGKEPRNWFPRKQPTNSCLQEGKYMPENFLQTYFYF